MQAIQVALPWRPIPLCLRAPPLPLPAATAAATAACVAASGVAWLGSCTCMKQAMHTVKREGAGGLEELVQKRKPPSHVPHSAFTYPFTPAQPDPAAHLSL